MYLLRRAAARALLQPSSKVLACRPVKTHVPVSSFAKPALSRSFHQTKTWRAEGAEEKVATPAETSEAGVETEPSPAEQQEIKEESIAAPDVADAAQPAEESITQKASDLASTAAAAVRSAASAPFDGFPPGASRDNSFARRPGNTAPSRILYCGNLFFEVTAAELEAEFRPFGEIVNSRIVTDDRGLSKGFGYVEFANQMSADKAVKELDQAVFRGRRMAVQYHVAKTRDGMRSSAGPRFSNGPMTPASPSKTLFIGNMSYQMSDKDLNDLFREVRDVIDVRVAIDRRSGQPRGFAHADFIDIPSAERAKEYLQQKIVFGRQLRVDFSSSSNRTQNA